MKKAKILLLDIDGVVNCEFTPQRWDGKTNDVRNQGFYGADPHMVARVNDIVRRTGCSVVLSSTWRRDPEWRDTMKKLGFDFEFLDRTPGNDAGLRGWEIKLWLEHNVPTPVAVPRDEKDQDKADAVSKLMQHDILRYAILDDNSDMLDEQLPNFFKTSWSVGLTKEIADKVVEHLNS